uniref:Uncharacterized protein n=1 Tax=Percolomonas cosmopolitus TaxID=63605 RepID=A0A7S1KUK2_9EUKA|mmetsp:Transcript_9615/g.35647  ORF Transcript_9615/g.35647 Transcript_9615/m.35647 type:complete len:142 (+) Transcript_9615:64-489(+)
MQSKTLSIFIILLFLIVLSICSTDAGFKKRHYVRRISPQRPQTRISKTSRLEVKLRHTHGALKQEETEISGKEFEDRLKRPTKNTRKSLQLGIPTRPKMLEVIVDPNPEDISEGRADLGRRKDGTKSVRRSKAHLMKHEEF